MTLNLFSLPSDVFARLLPLLDVKSNYHCSITCTLSVKLYESEAFIAYWKEISEKMGIMELLKGKTWKQTSCILTHRLEKPEYTERYASTYPAENDLKSSKFHELSYRLNNNLQIRDSTAIVDIALDFLGKLTQTDSNGSKELITIDLPEEPREEVCFTENAVDIHGCLMAITFFEQVLVEQDYGDCKYMPATQPTTILQVWNLETKKKLLERKFEFPLVNPSIRTLQIVLEQSSHPSSLRTAYHRNERYIILDLCLSKQVQDSNSSSKVN